jgi:hypothetical protein
MNPIHMHGIGQPGYSIGGPPQSNFTLPHHVHHLNQNHLNHQLPQAQQQQFISHHQQAPQFLIPQQQAPQYNNQQQQQHFQLHQHQQHQQHHHQQQLQYQQHQFQIQHQQNQQQQEQQQHHQHHQEQQQRIQAAQAAQSQYAAMAAAAANAAANASDPAAYAAQYNAYTVAYSAWHAAAATAAAAATTPPTGTPSSSVVAASSGPNSPATPLTPATTAPSRISNVIPPPGNPKVGDPTFGSNASQPPQITRIPHISSPPHASSQSGAAGAIGSASIGPSLSQHPSPMTFPNHTAVDVIPSSAKSQTTQSAHAHRRNENYVESSEAPVTIPGSAGGFRENRRQHGNFQRRNSFRSNDRFAFSDPGHNGINEDYRMPVAPESTLKPGEVQSRRGQQETNNERNAYQRGTPSLEFNLTPSAIEGHTMSGPPPLPPSVIPPPPPALPKSDRHSGLESRLFTSKDELNKISPRVPTPPTAPASSENLVDAFLASLDESKGKPNPLPPVQASIEIHPSKVSKDSLPHISFHDKDTFARKHDQSESKIGTTKPGPNSQKSPSDKRTLSHSHTPSAAPNLPPRPRFSPHRGNFGSRSLVPTSSPNFSAQNVSSSKVAEQHSIATHGPGGGDSKHKSISPAVSRDHAALSSMGTSVSIQSSVHETTLSQAPPWSEERKLSSTSHKEPFKSAPSLPPNTAKRVEKLADTAVSKEQLVSHEPHIYSKEAHESSTLSHPDQNDLKHPQTVAKKSPLIPTSHKAEYEMISNLPEKPSRGKGAKRKKELSGSDNDDDQGSPIALTSGTTSTTSTPTLSGVPSSRKRQKKRSDRETATGSPANFPKDLTAGVTINSPGITAVGPPSFRETGGRCPSEGREDDHGGLYCICRTPYDPEAFYIGYVLFSPLNFRS